jgi:hypothetical protein
MQQGDEGFGASVSTNEMDVSLNGINHQAGNVMGNVNGVQVFLWPSQILMTGNIGFIHVTFCYSSE